MPPTRDMTHTAGGTTVFPLFAFGWPSWLIFLLFTPHHLWGHGCEFLSARLSLLENNSRIALQITADFSSNPLLADEAAARQALQEVLRIEHDGKTKRLSELAPLDIQPISEWKDALPASLVPPPDGQPHQLLTAHWSWQPDVEELRFSVPQGCIHDVLLWQQEPGAEVKSTLLITGDVSPAITISLPSRRPHWCWFIGTALLLATLIKLWRRK